MSNLVALRKESSSSHLQDKSANLSANLLTKSSQLSKGIENKEKNRYQDSSLKPKNHYESANLWLEIKEVQELLNVSKRALQKACKAGKFITKTATGRGGIRYLIALSSLPAEARLKYYQQKGMLESYLQATIPAAPPKAPKKFIEIALARLNLVRLWREFRKGAGKKTEADRAFLSAYNEGKIAQNIYKILGEVSVKTLYRWIDQLGGTDDYTRLIPQWNPGSRRCGLTEEEKDIFFRFLLDPKNIKIGQAIRLTKFYLESRGIPSPSHPITFRRFAERWKTENYDRWVLMREGQKALRDKVETFIRRDPSLLEVGEVLVADGHRLNFQVINPFTGKPVRPVLVGFLDWKSFTLIGYEIMLTENVQCIASALRNAILRLGKFPKVVYMDNGKAFRAKYFTGVDDFNETGIYGLFARLGVTTIFAHPYNARAKVIERWFQEFTETFERLMPSFVGSSIQDRPAYLKRNEKFHKQRHKEYIPTIEETIQLIESWLQFEYSQPCPHVTGKTKGEVLQEGLGQGVFVDELDDLMMEEKITNITRNGIRFLKTEYWDEALYGMREQVIIKYSIFDLSQIKVYDKRGEFICIAKRREPVHPLAAVRGDAKDMEELKRQIAEQRRLEKKTIMAVKDLLKRQTDIQLDWQKAIEASPRIADRIEIEDLQLPPIEEHIPDEAVKIEPELPQEIEPNQDQNAPERPFFGDNEIARYEWHMKNGFHTQEDWEFKEYFESTLTYKMMKQFWEKEN